MTSPVTLYDYLPSGNGYKVRLVLRQLGIPYRLVQLDITKGETRTPEFLRMNPNGRIPLLHVENHGYLSESHAIIAYLAEGSNLIPPERIERARMWQWLCFEQYNLEPNIGTVRFWLHSLGKSPAELGDRLAEKMDKGYQALGVLERGLDGREYLVADRYTLADVGLYAYTHVATEGSFSLQEYPNVRSWLKRITARPGHSLITEP